MKRIALRRFIQKLKRKFRLTILNESTLENFFSLKVSLLDGIFLVATIVIIISISSWAMMVHTPLRVFLPQDLDPSMRKKLVQQALRVDSLSNVLELQSDYLKIVNAIVAGQLPVDSVQSEKNKAPIDKESQKKLKLMAASSDEMSFRAQYEESEKENLSILNGEKERNDLLFHLPLKGKIVEGFNPKLNHNGINIQSSGIQPCVSALPGTVMFAGYTSDYDYVIQLQHKNNLVTVYKYCTELLKKQGDVVRTGEAIGMVGVNPSRKGASSFEFEIWQKGIPLNPEEYIVF